MSKPKFTVVRSPDGDEIQHVLDPEAYTGWEILGTHLGQLGPDEYWDEKEKKKKVDHVARSIREFEIEACNTEELLKNIEVLSAQVKKLQEEVEELKGVVNVYSNSK